MSSDRPAPPKPRRSNEAPITKSGEIDIPEGKTIPAEFGIDLEGFDEAMEDERTRPGRKEDPDLALVVARLPKDDDTPVVPIKAAPAPPGPSQSDDDWNLPPTTVSAPPRPPATPPARPIPVPRTTVYGYAPSNHPPATPRPAPPLPGPPAQGLKPPPPPPTTTGVTPQTTIRPSAALPGVPLAPLPGMPPVNSTPLAAPTPAPSLSVPAPPMPLSTPPSVPPIPPAVTPAAPAGASPPPLPPPVSEAAPPATPPRPPSSLTPTLVMAIPPSQAEKTLLSPPPERPPQAGSAAPTAPMGSTASKSGPSLARTVPRPGASPATRSPLEGARAAGDHTAFRQETQRLMRARDWKRLALHYATTIENAGWAELPETRAALLLELARLYRDRLADLASAEETFQRLVQIDRAHFEAIEFLADRWQQRAEWRSVYDLYESAVEATVDPNRRVEFTRKAVSIATERLHSNTLVIEAWERLFRLGDGVDEASAALTDIYRRAERWDRLAEFLSRRASQRKGAERTVIMREVAETYLSGLKDHERAAEVLKQLLSETPDDPIALLAMARVMARRGDVDALTELADRPLEGQNQAAILDFRRLVGEALWMSGNHERSLAAYDRILQFEPDDAEAIRAKEEYLLKAGKVNALIAFLSERVERAAGEEEKVSLLGRAAELADRELEDRRLAVSLWDRLVAIQPKNLAAYQALADLHQHLDDPRGLAAALEGQLGLTRELDMRIELLRRLGRLSADRTGELDRAEAAWLEIIALVPDDQAAWDELIALRRKRQAWEGIDQILSSQAWRPLGDPALLELWRAAAENIEKHLTHRGGAATPPAPLPSADDSGRAVRAWQRVADLAPSDHQALAAIVRHERELGRSRELAWALEAEERAGADERVEKALEIADLWEGEGESAAAIAAYERVLRWNPNEPRALEALCRLRSGPAAGVALGALEVAAARLPENDKAGRVALARQGLPLLDKADKLGRFFALRRLLWLSGRDRQVLAEMVAAAEDAGAWTELAGVYLQLASESIASEARGTFYRELANIYERHLRDPVRAFLALQAIAQSPIAAADVVERLGRLAESTSRHEDHLALLDALARAGAPMETRQTALRQRAAILARLGDAGRAFGECARLLALDPRDTQALADARKYAQAARLWRQLDALYGELWDRAHTDVERIELARLRFAVRLEQLKDPLGALDQLLVIHRLDPAQPGITEKIRGAAEELRAWDRILTVLEGEARARAGEASPEDLAACAEIHEMRLGALERAFELWSEAFILRPTREVIDRLEKLAERISRREQLAWVLRAGAARQTDELAKLELYKRLAALYRFLNKPEEELDTHRRILQLQPSALASLDVVILHQRGHEMWRELRDSLRQWCEITPPMAPGRVEKLLEIAELSRERLNDTGGALDAYADVLQLAPGNGPAIEGIRSLSRRITDPTLELKLLRMQLDHAKGERRIELLLAYAGIEHERLQNVGGAIASLKQVVAESGAAGRGYEPLAELLRQTQAWSVLVDLMEERATALPDRESRLGALKKALKVCEEHPAATTQERLERLCKKIMEEAQEGPDDLAARKKVLALYRREARWDELVALLQETLERLPVPSDDDDDDDDDDDGGEAERSVLELERRIYEDALVRVLEHALGRVGEAEDILYTRAERTPDDPDIYLHLASIKRRAGDFAGYLEMRQDHARRQPPALAALTLCALAEACDETAGYQDRVPGFYREARALDPGNNLAVEALKAIGRRARNWRAQAALLPEKDEAKLSWSERAARLCERGEAAAVSDPTQTAEWFHRACAVDPDFVRAWDSLTLLHAAQGEDDEALEAQQQSLRAYERSTPPEPERLREHAERVQALADWVKTVSDEEGAWVLSQRAYDLQPSYPTAALAVAERHRAHGEMAEAYAIYDLILAEGAEPLTREQKLEATFQRGALAARLDKPEQAIADLRASLRLNPLHPGALYALADVLAAEGRVGAAVQHYIQALLVAHEPKQRGALYARLAALWEEKLDRTLEACVCYELAIAAGVEDRAVMARGLKLSRQSNRADRALATIEHLLPQTREPLELAELYTQRGDILADDDEDRAVESYDMALSYHPGHPTALKGLLALLEKRGEWEQVVELLQARAESGDAEDRADAHAHLTEIAKKLADSGDPNHAAMAGLVLGLLQLERG